MSNSYNNLKQSHRNAMMSMMSAIMSGNDVREDYDFSNKEFMRLIEDL